MKAAQRVLHYLALNPSEQLIFGSAQPKSSSSSSNPEFRVDIYSDSDWAEERIDRKSVSGMALMLNGRIVNWQSKKQSTVALSSTEAEFYALTEAVKEAIFIRQWFEHILRIKTIPTIYEDNNGAREIADHTTNHNKLKHVDIRHFFVRDHVKAKQVTLKEVRSAENIADIFTKGTTVDIFLKLKPKMF